MCLLHSLPDTRRRSALVKFHEGELGQMLSFLSAGSWPHSSSLCKSFAVLLTVRREGGRVQSGDWENLAVGSTSMHTGSGGWGKDAFTCALRLPTSFIRSPPPPHPHSAQGHLAPHYASWPGSPSASGSGSAIQVQRVYPLVEMGAGRWVGAHGEGDEGRGGRQPSWQRQVCTTPKTCNQIFLFVPNPSPLPWFSTGAAAPSGGIWKCVVAFLAVCLLGNLVGQGQGC